MTLALVMLIVFFILGWTYYMVATILMEGSIFTGLRMYIARRAETNRFCNFLRDMLGCLMCTATEATLWTLGLTSFWIGFHYRFMSHAVSVMGGRPILLPVGIEFLLAVSVAFALSLAVAGEAWGIKNVMENRDDKFLALRKEFRAREANLLQQIVELETRAASGKGESEFKFDLS